MHKRRPRPGRLLAQIGLPPKSTPLNPMRPDSEVEPQLTLSEIPPPARLVARFPPGEYLRTYRLGECSVIVTRAGGRWHLSIAHHARNPSWSEISQARYRILPAGIWMAMYLPPPEHYVNAHRFCYQLKQCDPIQETD